MCPVNRVVQLQVFAKTNDGLMLNPFPRLIDRRGRRNIAQHTYMCRNFRKFRPCRDACVGLWFAGPQPCVRYSVYRNLLSLGLTIRLRNAPYRNHCMVLLMLTCYY